MQKARGITLLGAMILVVLLSGCADFNRNTDDIDGDQSLVDEVTGETFIRLVAGTFDPLTQWDTFPFDPRLYIDSYADEKGAYLVQLFGPITAKMKERMVDLGVTIHGYIPDFTFLVWMDQASKEAVEAMPFVRWVCIYQPQFRVEPSLFKDQTGDPKSPVQLRIDSFRTKPDADEANALSERVEALGGSVLIPVTDRWMDVEITMDQIPDLAMIGTVLWIERKPVYVPTNDESRWIMDANDVWSVEGLYGSGQIVAVADTGLDRCQCGTCSTSNLHNDFENGSGGSRVLNVYDVVGDGNCTDNDGHGTHVAGSVAGNGDLSGASPASRSYPSSCFAGAAPEANIVFQATMDNSSGYLFIPALGTLFGQARSAGARIHTNSWGSSTWDQYTTDSHDADEYTWNNKDFLVLFSAGNNGADHNADGVIDLANIGSPGTAKNVLTVGASERDSNTGGYDIWGDGSWSYTYPVDPIASDGVSDDMDGLAAFSSRGPVADGRYKPDVVAPGTNIISTRSSASGAGTGWGTYNSYYIYMGGTSMSTPLAAGAAALIRDWFEDVQTVTPSGALLKASIANGAIDMTPGQYGTGSYREIPNGSDSRNVQGLGRVSIDNSISPDGNLIFGDESPGLSTGGEFEKDFNVDSGSTPLRITVAWTDCPGTQTAGGGLVNDLDVSLDGPSGTTYPDYANQRGSTSVISYYNGSGYSSRATNLGRAVRFTPSTYPSTIDRALIYLYDYYSNLPSYIDVNVYDDDGSSGKPGTLLYSETYVPIRQYGWYWYDYKLSSDVTISSGSFYIEVYSRSSTYQAPYMVYTTSNIQNRSWDHSGSTWTQRTNREYGIRAIVRQSDYTTDFDRVNNLLQINVPSPATGAYTLNVHGYNVPGCFGDDQQPFAYVISGEVSTGCSGCLIGGTCYSDGQTNPENICEICSVSQSIVVWSNNNGQTCDDGVFCNGSDSCQGGTCTPPYIDPCGQNEFCNDSTDTCDPYSICVDVNAVCLEIYLLVDPQAGMWTGSALSCTRGIYTAYATLVPGGWLIYLDYDSQGIPLDCSAGDYALLRGQGTIAAEMEWIDCVETGPTSLTAEPCADGKSGGFPDFEDIW